MGPTNGVLHPALTLLREDFEVQGARRAHSRFIDTATNQPRWFAQHRRTVLEAALFHGREKVSSFILVQSRLLRALSRLVFWGERV
jgi:hypothetical protein